MSNCTVMEQHPDGISRDQATSVPYAFQVGDVQFFEDHVTDHSIHRQGRLLVHETNVGFGQEEPLDGAGVAYYFLTGLTGSKESMAMAKCVAAQHGNIAYALAASHNQSEHALLHGAKEFSSVVNATEKGKRKRIVGLSMGGAIIAIAAEDCDDIEMITLVAPGGMVETGTTAREIAGALLSNVVSSQAARVNQLFNDPVEALHNLITEASARIRRPLAMTRIVIQGAKHSIGRAQGTQTELSELLDPEIQAMVHEKVRLSAQKAAGGGPSFRIVVPMTDKIINPKRLAAISRDLGVQDVVPYRGPFSGHTGGTVHPAQTKFILELDRHDLAA